MPRIRIAIGLLLYLTSCVALLSAPSIIAQLISAYPIDYLAGREAQIPAFSVLALRILPQATTLCLAVLGGSLLLGFLTLRRVRETDRRLFWIGVWSSLNLYTVVFLYGTLLIGYFLLPRLANVA